MSKNIILERNEKIIRHNGQDTLKQLTSKIKSAYKSGQKTIDILFEDNFLAVAIATNQFGMIGSKYVRYGDVFFAGLREREIPYGTLSYNFRDDSVLTYKIEE